MVKYTEHFRREVIKHYLDGKLGYKRVAAHYQISAPMIRRWVAAYRLHGEESVGRKRARYSTEFKLSVLRHLWDNALSYNQAAAVFNIPNPTTIGIWEKRYRDGGSEALARITPPIPEMPESSPQPDNKPEADSKPEQELSREQLLDRIEYLQMEVAVLKKLQALTQAKKAAALKKRK
jgi:transposase